MPLDATKQALDVFSHANEDVCTPVSEAIDVLYATMARLSPFTGNQQLQATSSEIRRQFANGVST